MVNFCRNFHEKSEEDSGTIGLKSRKRGLTWQGTMWYKVSLHRSTIIILIVMQVKSSGGCTLGYSLSKVCYSFIGILSCSIFVDLYVAAEPQRRFLCDEVACTKQLPPQKSYWCVLMMIRPPTSNGQDNLFKISWRRVWMNVRPTDRGNLPSKNRERCGILMRNYWNFLMRLQAVSQYAFCLCDQAKASSCTPWNHINTQQNLIKIEGPKIFYLNY